MAGGGGGGGNLISLISQRRKMGLREVKFLPQDRLGSQLRVWGEELCLCHWLDCL